MDIKIIDESLKIQWDDYLEINPYAIAWQSYDWSTVVKTRYPVEFFPIAAFEGRDICGVLPIYLVKGWRGKHKLISVPYAVAGGIVSDSEAITEKLLEKAMDLSLQNGRAGITLKQYKIKIPGDLQTDDNYYNRELSLSPDIDLMWDGFDDRNKTQLEKCKRIPSTLVYPSIDVDGFYKLLLKHQHNIGIPCVHKQWIRSLVDFKMYAIAFLKQNGNIVAATMIKKYKKTVSFPFTCIPDQTQVSYACVYDLYWRLITEFAQEGLEIFHSGRIPNSDQTDIYRLGWGGTKYTYYNQYYPRGESSTEYKNRRSGKRDLFTALWKQMPLPVTRHIGPIIVSQFP